MIRQNFSRPLYPCPYTHRYLKETVPVEYAAFYRWNLLFHAFGEALLVSLVLSLVAALTGPIPSLSWFQVPLGAIFVVSGPVSLRAHSRLLRALEATWFRSRPR